MFEHFFRTYFSQTPWLQIIGPAMLRLLFIILGAWAGNRLLRHLMHQTLQKAIKHKWEWIKALVNASERPLRISIWIIAAWLILPVLRPFLGPLAGDYGWSVEVLKIVLVCMSIWGLLRFIDLGQQVVSDYIEANDNLSGDPAGLIAVARFLQLMAALCGLLIVLSIMDIPLASLMTFGGVGALMVSLAAKDSLTNFFGGLLIYFDRPFSIGDWIYTLDHTLEGTVEKIGWRLTVLRTFDKRPVYVPNTIFSTQSIVNASRMTNRRIFQYIGLRYCDIDKVESILQAIREMLKNHPDIDQRQITLVNVVNGDKSGGTFAAYSINFMVYTFTQTTEWTAFQSIQDDVMLKIYKIIQEQGADIAFPTQSLYVEKLKEVLIQQPQAAGSPNT